MYNNGYNDKWPKIHPVLVLETYCLCGRDVNWNPRQNKVSTSYHRPEMFGKEVGEILQSQ